MAHSLILFSHMSFFPAFIVDAFTKEPYAGNQAAVCLIPKELKKEDYQKIAAEFNLSETAFPIPIDGDFKTGMYLKNLI
uniref:Isomerase n=1 Tax=Heterorhabditis bacteriophora TaxID=37862 RepID=A0A1I7WM97_HETBA